MENIIDLLERLHDYMDNRSDTKDGENGWPVPNEEMSFCVEIREAIEKLSQGKSISILQRIGGGNKKIKTIL
jgi:hypothetical protein